ncbi:hypothetical protein M3936_03590 [Sutcliffiella horikoshii]|uniref:hypothetical protein n=1 Tax=Sutcliffiella horikoshii TaxID=79883 RepID=UPI00203D6377|nr:hypothetical protein [Sutcliffiella horikoshii]MCM3616659.1 hypothetical protein [Sutcliffiella horikoshii]
MEDKDYYKIYESKVENVTVKIRKRYNVDLLAKAVIMVAEDTMARRLREDQNKNER